MFGGWRARACFIIRYASRGVLPAALPTDRHPERTEALTIGRRFVEILRCAQDDDIHIAASGTRGLRREGLSRIHRTFVRCFWDTERTELEPRVHGAKHAVCSVSSVSELRVLCVTWIGLIQV